MNSELDIIGQVNRRFGSAPLTQKWFNGINWLSIGRLAD